MVTTDRADWAERIRVLALHGMSRDAWARYAGARRGAVRGRRRRLQVQHDGPAGGDRPAAAGRASMRCRPIGARCGSATTQGLAELPLTRPAPVSRHDVGEPEPTHAHHLYTVLVDHGLCGWTRDDLAVALRERGIATSVHFKARAPAPLLRRALRVPPRHVPERRVRLRSHAVAAALGGHRRGRRRPRHHRPARTGEVTARGRAGGGAARPRARDAGPPTEVVFRVAASPAHRLRAPGPRHPSRQRPRRPASCLDPRHVPTRPGRPAASASTCCPRRATPSCTPDLALLVIDDPSRAAATPWLRAARRAGVPVVSLHDVGIAPLASDLAVDGSLGARRVDGPRRRTPRRAGSGRPTPSWSRRSVGSAAARAHASRRSRPRSWSAWAEGSRRRQARALPEICARDSIAFLG